MIPKKTNKPNTIKKQDRSRVFDYGMDRAFRQVPFSLEYIDDLAVELFEWASNDETATRLSKFFTQRGISGATLARWKRRSPKLKAAHAMAKIAIAERREDGGLFRKMDPTFVYRTMPLYDKDYEKLEKWRSELTKKNEQEEKTTTFNINIPKIKGSDNDESGKGS